MISFNRREQQSVDRTKQSGPQSQRKTEMKLTAKFQTVAIVGYAGSVSSKNENRSAHGAVCLLQARKGANGIVGRKVNSNGRHSETGDSFALDTDTLAHWERIAKASR